MQILAHIYIRYEVHSVTNSVTVYEEFHLRRRVKIFEFYISVMKPGVTLQLLFVLIKQTPRDRTKYGLKYFSSFQ